MLVTISSTSHSRRSTRSSNGSDSGSVVGPDRTAMTSSTQRMNRRRYGSVRLFDERPRGPKSTVTSVIAVILSRCLSTARTTPLLDRGSQDVRGFILRRLLLKARSSDRRYCEGERRKRPHLDRIAVVGVHGSMRLKLDRHLYNLGDFNPRIPSAARRDSNGRF